MASSIVRAVEDGIEFFTVQSTGESGMSVSGVARLCGVSQQAVSKLLKSLTTKPVSEWLESLQGKDLSLTTRAKKGNANVRVLKADVCAAIIEHYAFSGNKQAAYSMRKFNRMGINSWIQSITGWQASPIPKALYFRDTPKAWDLHFDEDWQREACRCLKLNWQGQTMAKFIVTYVYRHLGIWDELKMLNLNPNRDRYHQYLTEVASESVVKRHIHAVYMLLSQSLSRDEFKLNWNNYTRGLVQGRLI